ncbi:site-specific integrase [Clostridia bacterium]|nr:site-specific integrase [Clostridia bacterium]
MQGSVRKRGDKWYYSFELASINGKRKRVERVGGRTKKIALTAMRKAIEEYELAGQVADITKMSVADYFDYWLKNYVEVSLRYNTKVSYASTIKNHIKPALGSKYLKTLKPAAIQELLNQMHLNGYTHGTIDLTRGIMRKALGMAVYPYQFLHSNPAQYTSVPKTAKKAKKDHPEIITPEEFKQILELFPRGSRFHLPLLIGYHTGLRAAEVCGLTKDGIDLKEKKLSVNKIMVYESGNGYHLDDPKTPDSMRTITISKYLVSEIKNHYLDQKKNALKYGPHYSHSNFVCTEENGRPLNTNILKYMYRIIKKKTGKSFHFHLLRHTHASMLLAAGANIKAIQARLGHAQITTTLDTYSHITSDLEKTTAAFLEDLAN